MKNTIKVLTLSLIFASSIIICSEDTQSVATEETTNECCSCCSCCGSTEEVTTEETANKSE